MTDEPTDYTRAIETKDEIMKLLEPLSDAQARVTLSLLMVRYIQKVCGNDGHATMTLFQGFVSGLFASLFTQEKLSELMEADEAEDKPKH